MYFPILLPHPKMDNCHPESWVEVKPQQEGALAHSHSVEQVEELLASAVSEREEGGAQLPQREPTTLDSPTL